MSTPEPSLPPQEAPTRLPLSRIKELQSAFNGVEKQMAMSTMGYERAKSQNRAIDAAVAANVRNTLTSPVQLAWLWRHRCVHSAGNSHDGKGPLSLHLLIIGVT